MPLIRDYAAKHAADEARPLTYFSDGFTAWWPRLPVTTRRQFGPLLPELCEAFLSPDLPSQIQSRTPRRVARLSEACESC